MHARSRARPHAPSPLVGEGRGGGCHRAAPWTERRDDDAPRYAARAARGRARRAFGGADVASRRRCAATCAVAGFAVARRAWPASPRAAHRPRRRQRARREAASVTTRGDRRLAGARRLVLKIGSSLIVDEASGAVRQDWLDALADDVARLRAAGAEIIVVSSGAIRLGRARLALPRGALRLEQKQAAAAVGQIDLAAAWSRTLARHGIVAAQLLLTLEDSESRDRYLNARRTTTTLLEQGAVPVINENDTVATAEIRFGDNDRLAARVAEMTSADTLVLFSDIDGLYSADPRRDPDARFIPEVRKLTPEIEAMAGVAQSELSNGGMVTKLMAARIAMAAGCRMAIVDGRPAHPLAALLDGAARCTWFLPAAKPDAARKRWIAGTLKPAGALVVDDGAARALGAGKSLLPAGVVAVEGEFAVGAPVLVRDKAGRTLARGLVAYAAEDARRIAGRKSADIEAALGWRGPDELIHRDDLAMA
ncbi:MAG: glutamate 5-kinase [Rhodospirillales bacterium]|nr:MAG: glutamate 5-kinase [Rhodospirillales bacterium]